MKNKQLLITCLAISFILCHLLAKSQCFNCGTSSSSNTAFNGATVTGLSAFGLGVNSEVNGSHSIGIGYNNYIPSNSGNSVLLGNNNIAGTRTPQSFLFGSYNESADNTENTMLLGFNNTSFNLWTLGLGKDLQLRGEYSAALGANLVTGSSAHHSIALGFGTETFEPYSLAFAAGSITPAIYVKGNDVPTDIGFVGIGNKIPHFKLDVAGNICVTGENKAVFFNATPQDGEVSWGVDYQLNKGLRFFEPVYGTTGGGSGGVGDDPTLNIVDRRVHLFIQNQTGNVGINAIRPLQDLHVNGKILINTPNSSLLFDNYGDPENPNGRWGIKYESDGLNFWKPIRSLEAAPGEVELNYALFISDEEGKIGVGTELPETQLHVNGDLRVTDLADPNFITLNRFSAVDHKGNLIASEGLLVKSNNAVGIGLSTPGERQTFIDDANTAKLYVNGGIMATELWVKLLTEWSDFVFADNYKLRPLHEVESYIKEHKHLPDIPSADQVAEEGINVGQMDAKLLQKIEELTLYVIKQQKQIDEQQKLIIRQQEDLNKLSEKIAN